MTRRRIYIDKLYCSVLNALIFFDLQNSLQRCRSVLLDSWELVNFHKARVKDTKVWLVIGSTMIELCMYYRYSRKRILNFAPCLAYTCYSFIFNLKAQVFNEWNLFQRGSSGQLHTLENFRCTGTCLESWILAYFVFFSPTYLTYSVVVF